jgi:hypothetical protein
MFLDYTKTLRFDSMKSLEDSIESLSKKVHPSYFKHYMSGEMRDPFLLGKVTRNNVRICRVRPGLRNSFTPHFYGKFIEKDGKVFLEGKFTVATSVKVFSFVWLFGISCFLILGLLLLFSDPSVLPIGIVATLMIALHIIWKKCSYGNIEPISNEIREVLM